LCLLEGRWAGFEKFALRPLSITVTF
jgi:hypothetical protein